MTSDFDYKKYSLEKLQEWVHDAMNSDASPHEIYSAIREAVREEYYYHKDCISRASGLLELLSGHRPVADKELFKEVVKEREYYEGVNNSLSCNKDDKSPECQKAWNSFWEENYYPEEVKDDGMRPWGHSDLEYQIANNKKSASSDQSPKNGVTYSEYTKAKIEANSAWNDGWTQEYYQKIVDKYEGKQSKKWVLPVEECKDADTDETEYFVSFPDDLLEAANLKEGDQVEWVDQGDGSYLLKKHTERFKF
jgi:hypothetical protein